MPTSLHLEGELTIAHAASQLEVLLEALHAPEPAQSLDLSAVTEMDSAGLQLLLALRHSLRERQCELRVAAASPAVNEALRVYGLAQLAPAQREVSP
jgi:anti-sigma B factor antagonist